MLHTDEETTCPHALSLEDIHPMGRCEDCDIRMMFWYTLGMAEDSYRTGRIGQDMYEAYCHAFAAMSPHGALPAWSDESPFPRVRRLVRKLMRAKGFPVPGRWRGPVVTVEDASETGSCAESGPVV